MIKFNIENWVTNEVLKEVNISSLLFDDCEICNLDYGDIGLSLAVRGDVRIINEENGEIYKNYSQMPNKLLELIKNGKDISQYGYYVDMNNWFEIFIDKIDEKGNGIEMIDSFVADVEGTLDENNLKKSLLYYMLQCINDYVDIEDVNLMTLDKKEQLLLRQNILKNVYDSYKELSKKVNGIEDEEMGRDLYMKNHDYNWIEVLFNGTEKQFIIEVEGEDND